MASSFFPNTHTIRSRQSLIVQCSPTLSSQTCCHLVNKIADFPELNMSQYTGLDLLSVSIVDGHQDGQI